MAKITWFEKDRVSNAEEAVEALADFFSSTEGIQTTLRAHDHNVDAHATLLTLRELAHNGTDEELRRAAKRIYDPLESVEKFAKKWGVPFSRQMMILLIKQLDDQHQNEDDHWSSSSAYC